MHTHVYIVYALQERHMLIKIVRTGFRNIIHSDHLNHLRRASSRSINTLLKDHLKHLKDMTVIVF